MSLKQFLTKINPFKRKKVYARSARKQDNDPMEPKMPVSEAVKTIPKEMIEKLNDHKSVHFNNTKLSQEQQLELMEFIARFATKEEVDEYFYSNYKITLSQNLIYQYKRTAKWKPIIKKLREKYLLGEDEVAGRHKRVRLDRADKIYEKAFKEKDLKTALQANRDMQEMTEGRHVNQGDLNMTFNQYNVLDDEELKIRIAEAQEKLSRKTIDIKPKEITDGD